MSGILPDSGVVASQATNSVVTDTVNCGTPLFHATSRCQPRFDPAAANALISEVLNFVAAAGLDYDCTKLTNLSDAFAELLRNGVTGSGSGAPTAAPVNGLPPFYIDTSTTPDTLYWWDATPAPGTWYPIGTPDAFVGTGASPPAGVPASLPFYMQVDTGVSALWYYNGFGWVELANRAEMIYNRPCGTAPFSTPAEVADMAANPGSMVMVICNADATPTINQINGNDLATILGVVSGGGLSLNAGDIGVFNGSLPAGRWLVIGTVGELSGSPNSAFVGPWEVLPTWSVNVSPDASAFTPIFYGIGTGGAGITLGTSSTHSGAYSAIRIRLQP